MVLKFTKAQWEKKCYITLLVPLNNGTASQRSIILFPEKYPSDRKR